MKSNIGDAKTAMPYGLVKKSVAPVAIAPIWLEPYSTMGSL